MDSSTDAVVAILAPVGRDASACRQVLTQVGLESRICAGVPDLLSMLGRGADVVLLTEEALYGSGADEVADWVGAQPPWSDQPFVVLTSRNEGATLIAFRRTLVEKLGNVSLLERPVRTITLQTAVLSAQRGRRRQYQARAYLDAQRDVASELERLVARRTRDLQDANALLREEIERRQGAQAALLQAQKIETMGQLVGGVAHDFNNLLMAVIGNLDLLGRGVASDPRLKRMVDSAMEGARRGATLTQRLLSFARRQELQARATDVGALVTGLRGLIEQSVGPLARVEVDIQDDLPPVTVDPNQLEMALLNLAVNARDAMPQGGVFTITLRAETVAPGADLSVPPGGYVRLSARDTGLGMDAETLSRAVEPFFSTKGVGKGTGLGLSMVQGLALQSGGGFNLESAPGEGAVARLWLPVAAGTVVPAEVPEPPVAVVAPASILLVDDDPLIAVSTAALLEDLGHAVEAANSGPEALEVLASGWRPDLVITDHAMPGMTGAQLAARLRAMFPDLPILLATGFAELGGDQAAGLPRLAKPFTQDQLSVEISRLLATAR
jgi:signal transduction histidine kinase